MTLHQLKVFVAVAKLGSFTQASEALHISQPSTSSLISGLARELGAKLFERLGNRMHLTAAGERVLLRAEEALGKVDGIKEEIEELKGLKKGRIRVGGTPTAAASFLPEAIEKFKMQNSGIDVILKIDTNDVLQKRLSDGELDLAILRKEYRSSPLHFEPYRNEKILVVAPANHPLTRKRSVPLDLLAKERLIAPTKGAVIRDMVEKTFVEKGLPFVAKLEVDFQVGARDAIRNAVARGLGIGFLSECHVEAEVGAGRIKVLKVPDLELETTTYIAVHKKRDQSPPLRLFIEFLRELRKDDESHKD